MRRHARGVSRLYVELFVDVIWEPFERAGRPAERWPEVLDALERLRPLAAESLLAFFQMAMTEEVESTLGRELERSAREVEAQEALAHSGRLPVPMRAG